MAEINIAELCERIDENTLSYSRPNIIIYRRADLEKRKMSIEAELVGINQLLEKMNETNSNEQQ